MKTRKAEAMKRTGDTIIVEVGTPTDDERVKLAAYRPLTYSVKTNIGRLYETEDLYFKNSRDAEDYAYLLAEKEHAAEKR